MEKNKTDIWMPIYVGDYLSDTMHLTTEQHGAYFLLLLAYWKNRGPLLKNRVKPIVKIDNDSWTIVEEFFDTDSKPGFWVHARVEKELSLAIIRKQAAENRGKKGMEARWGDKKKDSSTIIEGIVEGIVGDSTSPSPSHKKKKDIYVLHHGDEKVLLKDGVEEVLRVLNEEREKILGRKLRPITSDANIIARLKEKGKSVHMACRIVITKAGDKYFRDNPKYLHPDTLFQASKWKKYLEEADLERA